MWEEIKEAMGPITCFIIGVFALPILLWKVIANYLDNK